MPYTAIWQESLTELSRFGQVKSTVGTVRTIVSSILPLRTWATAVVPATAVLATDSRYVSAIKRTDR